MTSINLSSWDNGKKSARLFGCMTLCHNRQRMRLIQMSRKDEIFSLPLYNNGDIYLSLFVLKPLVGHAERERFLS